MTLQLPACERCSQGVMDTTNDHARGLCDCHCHKSTAWLWATHSGRYLLRDPARIPTREKKNGGNTE